MKCKRYRVEWMHNHNWRMALNDALTFDTKEQAEKALAKEQQDSPTLKLRIVEVVS